MNANGILLLIRHYEFVIVVAEQSAVENEIFT